MTSIDYSIIVPVYNVEDTLSRCLDSIVNQTIKNFELILVDDGSKDRSGCICDEYQKKDERIRVFHLKNGGVSRARNKGIEVAQGKYIVFIDSDDYVDNTYLEKLDISDEDFIISDYKIEGYNANNEVKEEYKEVLLLNNGENITYLFEKNIIGVVWAKRYKHDIIEDFAVKFDSELEYGEDTLFNIVYLQGCKQIRIVNDVTYHYVRYQKDTLGIVKADRDSILKVQRLSCKLREQLDAISGINSNEMIVRRNGPIFYKLLLEIWNAEKTDYRLLRVLFKQTEFRKMIDYADIIWGNESKKFKFLLKTKSAFLIWIYLKIIK